MKVISFIYLGIDDQTLPCLTSAKQNVDDTIDFVTEKPTESKKKSLKRLKIVKF